MTARPDNLPDFDSPPLDEVVLGVQFAPSSNYSSVLAKDVWSLFQDFYTEVEEQPALSPYFETFGGSQQPQSTIKLQFSSQTSPSRLWFKSPDQSHLIQFQNDRFLLNWRKRSDGNEYPRFEAIAESFKNRFMSLQDFYEKKLNHSIEINQAEISYINIIPLDDQSNIDNWVSFISIPLKSLESVNCQFTEVINGCDGNPYGRLHHDLQSVLNTDSKTKALRLSLTFRGMPDYKNISRVMEFLEFGREKIVTRFTELTTHEAHSFWEKK